MSLAVIGVDGPNSSTDGHAALFDGATGKKVKDAGYTPREVLTAARTYYVRTDGSDSNTGLANTSGGAFLTLQTAWDRIITLDLGGFTVTIQVADGTYAAGISATAPPVGGTVTVNGNSGTPANVIVGSIDVQCPTTVTVNNFQIASGGNGLSAGAGGKIIVGTGMRFGACGGAGIRVDAGGSIYATTYTVAGGGNMHLDVSGNGYIQLSSGTTTVSGTPAFAVAFARADLGGVIQFFAQTFSGSATGSRYSAKANGVIQTNGGGASYLPGNSAGSTANGGQYL